MYNKLWIGYDKFEYGTDLIQFVRLCYELLKEEYPNNKHFISKQDVIYLVKYYDKYCDRGDYIRRHMNELRQSLPKNKDFDIMISTSVMKKIREMI